MHRILYISSAPTPLCDREIQQILESSRRNNEASGITGLLVAGGRRFLQVLEGPEDAVNATYQRISRDPRHRAMVKLGETSIAKRSFGDWSMGFQKGGDSDSDSLQQQVAEIIAPLEDATLKAYFNGFADRHNALK